MHNHKDKLDWERAATRTELDSAQSALISITARI